MRRTAPGQSRRRFPWHGARCVRPGLDPSPIGLKKRRRPGDWLTLRHEVAKQTSRKMGDRRFISMEAALRHWLRPYRKKEGLVVPLVDSAVRRRMKRLCLTPLSDSVQSSRLIRIGRSQVRTPACCGEYDFVMALYLDWLCQSSQVEYSENEAKQLWQAPKLISAALGSASRAPKRKPTLTFLSSKQRGTRRAFQTNGQF